MMSPVDFFRISPKKVCTECGEPLEEQAECYINECDHCLSKKAE